MVDFCYDLIILSAIANPFISPTQLILHVSDHDDIPWTFWLVQVHYNYNENLLRYPADHFTYVNKFT